MSVPKDRRTQRWVRREHGRSACQTDKKRLRTGVTWTSGRTEEEMSAPESSETIHRHTPTETTSREELGIRLAPVPEDSDD